MIPFYWKVGDDIYYNDIAAYQAATSTNKQPKFFISTVSDGPHWRKEPPKSVYSYMDDVSRHLDSKYDKITLMYSGGTDSHTILESFIRCGIKNVTLVMFNTEDHRNDPERMLMNSWTTESLKRDYKFLFTEWGYTFNDYTSDDSRWNALSKDELSDVLHNYIGSWSVAVRPCFGSARYPNSLRRLITEKTAIVWGYEKPLIEIHDGWFCWSAYTSVADYLDMGVDANCDNVFFYYSDAVPELQVKLAWLKLAEITKILDEYKIPITNESMDFIQHPSRTYSIYSRINHACGYKGLNLNLDSAASKISPYKKRSNYNSQKASEIRGDSAIIEAFHLKAEKLIDPIYYAPTQGTLKGMKAEPIRIKRVSPC